MKYVIGFIAATILWAIILSAVPMPEERVHIYDCGMAEWHPDILKHPNRFDGAPAPLGFNKIYWCESYVETMLCQHYLGSVGEESVTKRDFTLGTWSIFTNYDVDKWVN